MNSLAELVEGDMILVIAFVCNHCPYVIHLAEALQEFAEDYIDRGVQVVAINSNDVANYPADAPEKMLDFAAQYAWDFPYLYDETQQVAQAYAAACTPDFYVFNEQLELAYAGQFDATRPGKTGEITGIDLRSAVDHVLDTSQAVEGAWQPSSGCNIKWKEGNAPEYF